MRYPSIIFMATVTSSVALYVFQRLNRRRCLAFVAMQYYFGFHLAQRSS
jgi:hypothetical protein